jgi:CRISPR-associated protein Csh1
MIKEIIQFVDILPEEAFTRNLTLNEGFYLFLDIQKENDKYQLMNVDENGIIQENNKLVVDKNTDPSSSPLYKEFLFRFENSKMINAMKSFNSSAKIFIAIGTPFGLSVKKKVIEESIAEQEKQSRKKINEALDFYFKRASDYIDKNDLPQLKWLDNLQHFTFSEINNIQETFINSEGKLLEPLNKLLYYVTQQPEYSTIGKNAQITLFLREPSIDEYKSINKKYLSEKVFNKDDYNKQVENIVYGISDSLSGFNDKKVFLQHKTAPLEYNLRVNGENAIKLYRFFELQKNKGLPNPTPIFVDKEELSLNNTMVTLYNDNKNLSYSEIIRSLLERKQTDLQNFYLIFFQGGLKGSRIIDLDFVPVFRYKIDDIKIREVFKIGGHLEHVPIENVFDFQSEIVNRIFNDQLMPKNGNWLNYFNELEPNPKYHFTDTICNLLYKYRKAFYDYIYKSKREAITTVMFDDMMAQSILDDIRHDNKPEQSREYIIKEKLNIWFSLYNYFQNNNKTNRNNMVNKTAELTEKLKEVARNEHLHIGSDDEFAFDAGQLIWKILSQSKSASRSHALLEPFLQKVDPTLFKQAIAKAFDTYKHEFVFYSKKYEFDKIMSEVMGFEPNEKNMKNQLPLILAGYFAETIFKADSNN